jgi:hypothetical protein
LRSANPSTAKAQRRHEPHAKKIHHWFSVPVFCVSFALSRRKNIPPDDRAPQTKVARKFMDNTHEALTPERAANIIEMALNVGRVASARALAEMLTTGGQWLPIAIYPARRACDCCLGLGA